MADTKVSGLANRAVGAQSDIFTGVAGGANFKMTGDVLLSILNALTQLASGIDFDADFLELYDADAAVVKKVLAGLLFSEYGTRALIHDETLGAAAASFDIQNIPATYAHLEVIAYLRTDRASTDDAAWIRFNNDAGNNYDSIRAYHVDTSIGGDTGDGPGIAGINGWGAPGNTAPANHFGSASLLIPNYAGTANHKSCHGDSFYMGNTASNSIYRLHVGGRWRNTAAINRITIYPQAGPNFMAGSRVTLYGLNA